MVLTHRGWCFTINNPKEELKYDDKVMNFLIYQLEQGINETLHYQGYVQFRYNTSAKVCKKRLGGRAHVELQRGSVEQNVHYCSKPVGNCDCKHCERAIRKSGPWVFGKKVEIEAYKKQSKLDEMFQDLKAGYSDVQLFEKYEIHYMHYRSKLQASRKLLAQLKGEKYVNEIYKNKVLTGIQQEMLIFLQSQNNRQIGWIVDYKGGLGKTELSKWLIVNKGAIRLTSGGTKDLAFCYNGQSIVIFDLPRTMKETLNYQVIEGLKDGILFSGKYESEVKIFKPPHIYVFSNFYPNVEALSKDRWLIKEYNKDLNPVTRDNIPDWK